MTLLNETGEKQYKVMIAVPCGDQVAHGFAQDLALMMSYTTFVKPEWILGLYFLTGTILPRARAALVAKAIERGDTHILWLDADMRFPKDTLIRLLGEATPIICANYATRQAPILPTVRDLDHAPLFQATDDVTQVSTAGMGVMLTETKVFREMEKPYFAIGYNREMDDYAGEDTFFCERAKKAGFTVYVDPHLSEVVRHVGSFDYEMAHTRMTRDAALAARE